MHTRRATLHGVLLALLLISLALPSLEPVAGWDAASYLGWPAVGLSAALFVAAGDRGRWITLGVQVVLIAATLHVAYGVAWWECGGAGLVVTLPASVSAHWLRPDQSAFQRFNEDEVDRYHGATALVGLLFGGLVIAAAVLTQHVALHHALLTGLIAFVGATTSQLLILPFLLRTDGGWGELSTSVELWGQRLMLLVFVTGIFAWQSALPVAFLLFPIIGWAAIRARAPETHVQVLIVSVVACVATAADRGPFALGSIDDPRRIVPLLVLLFVAALLYLLVPLALTMERLTSVTRQATRSASTVRRMLDSATGTVFLATDPAGIVTHVNPGAEEALGYSAAEVLGHQTTMLHTEEEVARQAAFFGLAATSSRPLYDAVVAAQVASGVRRDWEFRRKDGDRRMVSLNISVMHEPSGAVAGFIVSGEDITERVRAQEALQKAFQRERDSAQALREADGVKQELVSTVSHELRTPITNITGYAEVLVDGDLGELNDEQRDAVDRIERNSARLRELVDDLLTLSSTESGALQALMTPVDLNDVVAATHELLATQLDTRSLRVRLDLAPQPVTVLGDRGLLERAVTNLLTNAMKFTPDGGEVRLSVVPPPSGSGEARSGSIVVADSGIGIPEHEQAQVFTRFYRASAAGEKAIQGSGLGLSIVKAIVEQHDGQVSLRSSVGEGSTFTLSIPVLEQQSVEDRDVDAAADRRPQHVDV